MSVKVDEYYTTRPKVKVKVKVTEVRKLRIVALIFGPWTDNSISDLVRTTYDTIWYDTIEEFNVDSKAEYTA